MVPRAAFRRSRTTAPKRKETPKMRYSLAVASGSRGRSPSQATEAPFCVRETVSRFPIPNFALSIRHKAFRMSRQLPFAGGGGMW